MAIQIFYNKYSFSKPSILNIKEFEYFKDTLRTNPDLSLEPKYLPFFKISSSQGKLLIIMSGILLFLLLINILAGAVSSKHGNALELVLAMVLVFYFLGYFGLLISKYLSYKSFSDFKWESKKYYTQLKRLIIESDTYDIFILNYSNAFKNLKSSRKDYSENVL